MDVDDAGENQQARGVDDLVRSGREAAEVWLDGRDPPAVDRHVGA